MEVWVRNEEVECECINLFLGIVMLMDIEVKECLDGIKVYFKTGEI
jgi:hypothetical protein